MNIRYVITTRKIFDSIIHFLIWVLFFFSPVPPVWGGSSPVILAFGDSLTAGFGVPDSENYPARLQRIISQNGYPHQVIN